MFSFILPNFGLTLFGNKIKDNKQHIKFFFRLGTWCIHEAFI